MELAGIIALLTLAVGGLTAVVGIGLHSWVAGHQDQLAAVFRLADGLLGRLPGFGGRVRRFKASGTDGDAGALVLTLLLGLAAIAVAAVGLGVLVENVTDGDGVAILDHPVARFVAGHRTPVLTSVMNAVSAAAGPAGMAACALAVGLLLGVAWRSWTPAAVLGTTAAGAIGLTIVFKAALAQPRPPLAQAVAVADGYGFPSGHAAAAAAVCGAAAWLCSIGMRSWRARLSVWVVAAMLAALVGVSRVYLGVHWVTDVLGGWAFGILWMAVVVTGWAGIARASFACR